MKAVSARADDCVHSSPEDRPPKYVLCCTILCACACDRRQRYRPATVGAILAFLLAQSRSDQRAIPAWYLCVMYRNCESYELRVALDICFAPQYKREGVLQERCN